MAANWLDKLFRFGKRLEVDVAAANVTLTSDQLVTVLTFKFTGAPGATRVITAPSQDQGHWIFWNACTDGSSVTIQSSISGLASITLLSGEVVLATFDKTVGWKIANGISVDRLSGIGFTASGVAVGSLAGVSGGILGLVLAKAAAAASQAGRAWAFIASSATAGASVDGAAEGGGFEWTTGNAARRNTGNADGGFYKVTLGNGIGTGISGAFRLLTVAAAELFRVDSTGVYAGGYKVLASNEVVAEGSVATADATSTEVATLATAANTGYTLEMRVTGQRTSDRSIVSFRLSVGVKNVAGVLTILDLGGTGGLSGELDSWNFKEFAVGGLTLASTGATFRVLVGGAAATPMTWSATIRGTKVS